ncbi:Vacuolar protein sorting-associated protein 62, partial [Metarhizium brunneum ARSEF 3297]
MEPRWCLVVLVLSALHIGPLLARSVPYGDLMTVGEGYNTFLGKGVKHGAVQFSSVKAAPPENIIPKRSASNTPTRRETNPFQGLSVDMFDVDLDSYFIAPDPKMFDEPMYKQNEDNQNGINHSVAHVKRNAAASCPAEIDASVEFISDYESYLKVLDVSASATISGYGQTASASSSYLDKSRFASNTLTYMAIINIKKQINTGEEFAFNTNLYSNSSFAKTFGDRWIRGFQMGAKLVARISLTAKEKSNQEELKATAVASLAFWGVSGQVNTAVTSSMQKLNTQAHVKVDIFYQGEIGKQLQGQSASTSGDQQPAQQVFANAKSWADLFLTEACKHNYKYQALLDEYPNIKGFPENQAVLDYSTAERVSYRVLSELVKISELAQVLRKSKVLNQADGDQILWDELAIVEACKTWVQKTAATPNNGTETAKELIKLFDTAFYEKWRPRLKDIKGDLTVQNTTEFVRVWDDRGSGAARGASFWLPRAQGELRPLGSMGVANYDDINSHFTAVLVAPTPGRTPSKPVVASPVGFNRIWRDLWSGANSDGSFWRPTAPEGYKCIGDVVQNSWSEPNKDAIWCLRADLVKPSAYESPSLWDDKGSGSAYGVHVYNVQPRSDKRLNVLRAFSDPDPDKNIASQLIAPSGANL